MESCGGWVMRVRVPGAILFIAVAITTDASLAAAGSRDAWSPLRRPLHMPTLTAGARCPVSRADPGIRASGVKFPGSPGIGRGPVSAGLGPASGLLYATRERPAGGPWFGAKVFWYILPSYQGPALIRGRRLDGPQLVRFGPRRMPAPELRIDPGQTTSWEGQPAGSRGVPSTVRVKEPGCYAFQIDGASFSRIVVFIADLAR
jgi:hypothetical protein